MEARPVQSAPYTPVAEAVPPAQQPVFVRVRRQGTKEVPPVRTRSRIPEHRSRQPLRTVRLDHRPSRSADDRSPSSSLPLCRRPPKNIAEDAARQRREMPPWSSSKCECRIRRLAAAICSQFGLAATSAHNLRAHRLAAVANSPATIGGDGATLSNWEAALRLPQIAPERGRNRHQARCKSR